MLALLPLGTRRANLLRLEQVEAFEQQKTS
jgi:hypothetical protein